jgi:hypothetical protein
MAITQKSIKILWSAAAGRCAFPHCEERLTYSEAGDFAPYTLGEMAHICGDQPGSNRHYAAQTPQQRDDYQNLILLCPTHHTLIDRPENVKRFPADLLLRMKADHEAFIHSRIEIAPPRDKSELAREIAPLLTENHQVWLNYGPRSEIARKNPHSDAAYAVWLSERLTTIVPYNRRISEMLKAGNQAFAPDEQEAIALFLIHARSYEMWVQDEISYDGVTRFPQEFEALIKETAIAGS